MVKPKFKVTIRIVILMILFTIINLYINYSSDSKSFKFIERKDYDWINLVSDSRKIMISDYDDKNYLASIIDDTIIYPRRFSKLINNNENGINLYIYKDNEIESSLNYSVKDNVVYGRYFWLGLNNNEFRDFINSVLND